MPVPIQPETPSSNQVKKAASRVRRYFRGDGSKEDYDAARKTIQALRTAHSPSLVRVNNRLRYTCTKLELPPTVTQRLKKLNTIVDKLQRESTLDLRRMRDIGGCRLVLDGIDDVTRVFEAIYTTRSWKREGVEVQDPIDYIQAPRSSGYRAMHVPVVDQGRTIEIQLRTAGMHEWAELVEDLSGALGTNYKHDGNHPFQQYFAALAELYAYKDSLRDPPSGEHLTLVDTLRHEALGQL